MSYNVPVRHLQQGSVLEASSSGTVLISSGGSIQVASGGVLQVAAGGSIVNAGGNAIVGVNTVASGGTLLVASGGSVQVASGGQINVAALTGLSAPAGITLGGTLAKWAFGTVGLTSAVGTIGVPGFTRVLAATANAILGEAAGNGSTTSVQIDLSLSGAGSIIFHTSIGTLPAAVNGTVTWMAFGT